MRTKQPLQWVGLNKVPLLAPSSSLYGVLSFQRDNCDTSPSFIHHCKTWVLLETQGMRA